MKTAVETPVIIGDAVVAALVLSGVTKRRFGGVAVITARKHPVALLIRIGPRLHAYTPQGSMLQPEQVEALCPGAVSQIMSHPGARDD